MRNCSICGEKADIHTSGMCWKCGTLKLRLDNARFLARAAGLPHDLTLQEWHDTILTFAWKCAYCHKPLTWETVILEHFMPISMGGGTTKSNCVPACQKCNSGKKINSRSVLPGRASVEAYLATLKG